MPKDYVKENPRVLNADVYRYISRNSSLSKKEVKECFDVYKDMVEKIFFSEFVDEDTTVVLPNVGSFKLKKRKGRKKGSTYNMPMLAKNGERIVKEINLTEDELDSCILSFKVSPILNTKLKEQRKEYERHKLQ